MTGARPRAAVLGRPIAHSRSPVLHRAAYAELGLDWRYDLIDCGETELPAAYAWLARSHVGLSLTMPLKRAVLALLDSLDELAERLEAVNTVVFTPAGGRGYNTDVAGVLASLDELGVAVAGAAVAVLGGGGAARAVLAGLAQREAARAVLCLRDPARGEPLTTLGEQLGLAVEVVAWERARSVAADVPLVVATTPAGATDELAQGGWPREVALFDLGYAPWPSQLGVGALAAGAPVVGGLTMLVAQAAAAVELMTGRAAPVAAMRAAGERALAAR